MFEKYGPLAFFIGEWTSGDDWKGKNQAPDSKRETENTRFRQVMKFEPIGDITNHEQTLYALRYSTKAFEQGLPEKAFHEEVGYWIWDHDNKIILKSFIVPRGISVNAGGIYNSNKNSFRLSAKVGDHIYGISSNEFLDREFKSMSYDLEIEKINEDTFTYRENTQIKMPKMDKLFQHTEENTLVKVRQN